MKLLISRKLAVMASLLTLSVAAAALPSAVHASDAIYFNSPIINVGFIGKHRGSFNRGFRSNRGFSSSRGFRSNRGFRSSNRFINNGFRSSRSLNRGFRSFNNRFNRGFRSSNRGFSRFDRGFTRSLNRGFSSSKKVITHSCSIPGYYQYRNDGLSCYQHNGHFHCE